MNEIVLGSFFGDEGKGQAVHNLCKNYDDVIVVRFSGANQVGHNVSMRGIHHCFSNYGSGTLLNVPTYWSEYCVCDPYTAITELLDLKVFPKIIYSPNCELVLPCDVWSQWNNKENREHGTVGTGYKAVLDRVKAGYHVTIVDALNPLILIEKLKGVMKYYYKYDNTNLPCFSLNKWAENVSNYANKVEITSFESIYHSYSNLIFEGSQGILLDQTYGIMPHCTPSNTTSRNAFELLNKVGQRKATVNYVCRPYITRHGNGPFCTSTPIIDVVDPNNSYSDFQKSFRACEFDINLLKHSIKIDSLFSKDNDKCIIFSHYKELSEDLLELIKNSFTNIKIKGFEYEEWY